MDKNHRFRFQSNVRCNKGKKEEKYYVVGGLGCKYHNQHLKMYDKKLIKIRKSIITDKALKHMQDLKD